MAIIGTFVSLYFCIPLQDEHNYTTVYRAKAMVITACDKARV
jgi:hypothetical protein